MTCVGVVIVDYQRPDLAARAVESVLASRGVSTRLVVVDNDPDGHGELASRLPAGTHVVETGVNGGYAAGMNAGVRALRPRDPDLLCLLNNDAVLDPDALATAVAAFDRSDDLQVAALNQTAPPGEPSPTSCAILVGHRERPVRCSGDCAGDGLHRADLVSGPALIVRAASFEAVGGLDERYFHYYEEVDLSVRLIRRSGVGGLLCRAQLTHAKGSTLSHASADAAYYRVRNYLLYRRRLYGEGAVQATRASRPFAARCLGWTAGALLGRPDRARAVVAGWRDGRNGRGGPRGAST
jgi:N-acetylglucosaminyl-diphospho-decaprenol L-rhamnosyltransferase